jgi:hypothetical protein
MRAAVRRPFALVAALLALAVTTTACVGMPDAGPVVTADPQAPALPEAGVERRAQPPQEGDSPQNIVNGFLLAMTAYPVSLQVAREFLTTEEQQSWDPSKRTITYDGPSTQKGDGGTITVRLKGARWIDSRGAWRGQRGDGRPQLHFTLVDENSEWRISSAPNSFVVPDDWFQAHYVASSVYYFDPTASILVAEPVLVPADQRIPALVQALLDGPGPRLEDVVRSFVPDGLTLGLSVPVDAREVAAIDLDGTQSLTAEEAKLMVYQFAWTLNQDLGLSGFTISIGGNPVSFTGSSNTFSVDLGSEFNPSEVQASGQLYGLRSGLLEAGDTAGDLQPVEGPFGTLGGIESVGVSLTATYAAAVVDDRHTVLRGSVNDDQHPVVPVVSDATELLRPAWDFSDRMWLVDRTTSGALVSYLDATRGSVPTQVEVRGITGRQVKRFLVSRDGTRLVAVVRGAERDELRIARIRHSSAGAVIGVAASRAVSWSSGDTQRILDIGWRSPTQVAVLHRLTQQVWQVSTISVDGAGGPQERVAQAQEATALVSAPDGSTLYTRTPDGLLDLDGGPITLPLGFTSIQYVG